MRTPTHGSPSNGAWAPAAGSAAKGAQAAQGADGSTQRVLIDPGLTNLAFVMQIIFLFAFMLI